MIVLYDVAKNNNNKLNDAINRERTGKPLIKWFVSRYRKAEECKTFLLLLEGQYCHPVKEDVSLIGGDKYVVDT